MKLSRRVGALVGTGLPPRDVACFHVAELPALHADPFDRLLIAQGQLEDLPILAGDAEIARYPVAVIW